MKSADMLAQVKKGPVAIAMYANDPKFQAYSSGIIKQAGTGSDVDHAMVIVGHGEEGGIKYWIVRNSWGTSWGEDGYARFEMSDAGKGTLGMNQNSFRPKKNVQ